MNATNLFRSSLACLLVGVCVPTAAAYSGMGQGVLQGTQVNASPAELLRAARGGDVESMRILGKMLIEGKGVKRDVKNGVKWMKMAADAGDAGAMLIMGDLHRNGTGVAKNIKMAVEYYILADENGNKNAAKRLQKLTLKEALPWWEKKAEAGDKKATLKLMLAFAEGDGVDKDLDKARELYKLASEKWPSEARELFSKVPLNERIKMFGGGSEGGFDALYKAASKCNEELVLAYIERGEDVNARNSDGNTVLMELASSGRIVQPKALLIMIKAGADVNAQGANGNTPLMRAARYLNVEKAQILLNSGADVNMTNNQHSTAMEWMYMNVYTDLRANLGSDSLPEYEEVEKVKKMQQMFLNAGANVNHRGHQGYTAITRAFQQRYYDCVDALLAKGAKVNSVAENGDSPFVIVEYDPLLTQSQKKQWFEKLRKYSRN